MGVLTLRMTDEEEGRFRAAAARSGLKTSHFLRRMIERELREMGLGKDDAGAVEARVRDLELYAYLNRPDVKDRHRREFDRAHPGARNAHLRPDEPKRPKGLRFQLSLSAEEVLAVEHHGIVLELRPAQFCTVLVRRWLGLRKAPPASTANALGRIRNELRRIGVNINQIARAANEFANPTERTLQDRGLMSADDLAQGLGSLPAFQREIVGLVADVDVLLGRERRYWDIRTVDTQEVDLHPSIASPDEPL
jgi:predicted DNA-binding protein